MPWWFYASRVIPIMWQRSCGSFTCSAIAEPELLVEPHRLMGLSPPTILIAEDDADMRGAVAVMLEREGFQVGKRITGPTR